jgi:hypothetical protein
MLYQLIYHSIASAEFGVDESLKMLFDARIANSKRDITGMLLYHKGQFLQVLEGDQAVLANLREKIFDDPRHHSVELLACEPIAARSFQSWSMAFANLSDKAHTNIQGLRNINSAMLEWESSVLGLKQAKQLLREAMKLETPKN